MDQKFFNDYIANFSVSPLTRQTNLAISKLEKLKTDNWKKDYAIILYSSYIQLIENFIMFMLVLLDDAHLENLFELQTKNIVERYGKLFWIENWKISFLWKQKIKNILKWLFPNVFTEDIAKNYAKFITESLEDFVQDKNFLNSFKHWMRVQSIGKTSYRIGLIWWTQEFWMWDFNCSIRYYSKEIKLIYENTISFNYEYVHAKIAFLENILENLKKKMQTKQKSFKIKYFYSPKEELLSKYWIFRLRQPIFESATVTKK